MTIEAAIETVVTDGINIYIRDVLAPSGYIHPDKADSIACPELVKKKYELVRMLASNWAEIFRSLSNEPGN